ncbi:MAG: SDR family NAD(P)-dependent oxidoreductase [Bacteroidales bacterium]|nr:SDR family NAD(P)-dependent oxidoreductase [Bacteroidales bacterium]
MTNKIALITGASSGIGEATALILAKNNYNVIITGRRESKLKEVEKKISLESDSQVLILSFDISNQVSCEKAIDSLSEKWKNIDVLINNAGLAVGLSTFQDGIVDDWERMIDTNIKGLLYISRKVSEIMIARKTGHIVNIGSIAGKEVYPNGNIYCATKHAVEALTKAMRIDLLPHGIKVSGVCPGMVETEFSVVRFKGDEEKASKVYQGLTPLYAEDIAEVILFVVSRPPHVNINDILVMPTIQASSTVVFRGL